MIILAIASVFAPGVISGPAHDSAPAFAPDGNTVYFARTNNNVSMILESHRSGSTWSQPVIAPFSGAWKDQEPTMAPDGSFLIFVSNRPAKAGGAVLDGSWGGKTYAGGGGNLWRVDRNGSGWSDPVRLPDIVNRSSSVFAPAIVKDGSIWFMDADKAGKFHLYRAQNTKSGYDAPVALPFGDPKTSDVDPAVAPDESYAVFGSGREPGQGSMDLFLVKKKPDGTWDTPKSLGDINSPASDAECRFSPDAKTLYFSSDRPVETVTMPRSRADAKKDLARLDYDNGLYNIWFVDLRPVL
ncbi:MAG: hypothetical protein QM831_32400 [Kofleriaceae bacterium]